MSSPLVLHCGTVFSAHPAEACSWEVLSGDVVDGVEGFSIFVFLRFSFFADLVFFVILRLLSLPKTKGK